ncbi:DUF7660 family protein [Streptomyces sp. NPDC001858]
MTSLLAPDDHIDDREAFVAFLARLRADHAAHGQQWENTTLSSFLEALEAWTASSPSLYRNLGRDLPIEGDWTFFARALAAATIYE